MEQVFVSLGSNLGDPLGNLRRAIVSLREFAPVVALSDAFESEPVEFAAQPWFVNAVVALRVDSPLRAYSDAHPHDAQSDDAPQRLLQHLLPSSAPWAASVDSADTFPRGRASSILISSCMAAA